MQEVLYLSARLPENRPHALPALSCAIPECGAWIRSRGYIESNLLRMIFEFPRVLSLEIYSALVETGLELAEESHLTLTELCRRTPFLFRGGARASAPADEQSEGAACAGSSQIVRAQIQILFESAQGPGPAMSSP